MCGSIPRALFIGLLIPALGLPLFAQRGSANFTRYVALGDSLTAGFSSGSLVLSHQQWSYPAIIARQAGVADFEQPLISEPGIPAELALQSLVPLVIGPKSSGNGQPIHLLLPRPYDNLGIPGADTSELLTLFGGNQDPIMFQLVLRGLGPAVAQAAALQPTFVSLWIGNNDVLGAVTSGIVNDQTLTPVEVFTQSYETLLDTLIAAAPNAGMVTAMVPPVTEIPFASVLPPVLLDPQTRQPVLDQQGRPIFLVAQFGDGSIGQLPPGSRVTLAAQPFLATGYGIPAALAPLIPLPDVGKPLPNATVLDPAEVSAIESRRQEINHAIQSAATARDIPVVMVDPIFAAFEEGVHFAGIELSLDYLTGGIMSFDGLHPTDIGYSLVANAFIERINASYDAGIPYASLLSFFADNAPVEASVVMLPSWMRLNLLQAPWTHFASGMANVIQPGVREEPSSTPLPTRRRSVRRGHD